MRFFSLRRRVSIIERRYGIELSEGGLRLIYKRHRIRFKQAKRQILISEAKEAVLMRERIQFSVKLQELLDDPNADVIFLDEATFGLW